MTPEQWENRKKTHLRQMSHQLLYRSTYPTAEDKQVARLFRRVFRVALGCELLIFIVLWMVAPAILARLPSGVGGIPLMAAIVTFIVWQLWRIVKGLKANEAAGIAPAPQTPADTERLVFCGTFFLFMAGWAVIGSSLHWDTFVLAFGGMIAGAFGALLSSRVARWYLQRRGRRAAQQT